MKKLDLNPESIYLRKDILDSQYWKIRLRVEGAIYESSPYNYQSSINFDLCKDGVRIKECTNNKKRHIMTLKVNHENEYELWGEYI